MSDYRQPGLHPDAESLSAFVEGALPEHERLECLAHLSECARCREIVFLAQEPVTPERPASVATEPVPWWKRWMAPVPLFSAAAVACSIVILTIVMVQKKQPPAAPVMTAMVRPPEKAPTAPAPPEPAVPEPKAAPAQRPNTVKPAFGQHLEAGKRASAEPLASTEVPSSALGAVGGVPPTPAQFAPLAAPRAAGVLGGVLGGLPAAPPPPPATSELASVAGSVTDASGAGIPNAAISLRSATGTETLHTRTDVKGQFTISGLTPGPYEMSTASPGFKQESQRIEVQPHQAAVANSVLQVGSVSESVSVTAESRALQTETASVAPFAPETSALPLNGRRSSVKAVVAIAPTYVLPNKLPPPMSAAKDKLVVAADSQNALFVSNNAGKSWKPVKPVWPGRLVSLSVMPDPAAPTKRVFRLTTDSPSVWLSSDGNRWYPASSTP